MALGKKVIIFAEDAFEDMELMYPKVFFADLGCKVTVAGTGDKQYRGKYGYPVSVNGEIWDFDPKEFDAVIVPGGWAPDRLRRYAKVLDFVKKMDKEGKVVASICHGPWVLASAGIVRGKRLTCTPAIKDDMINAGAHYSDEKVIVDGSLVTSRNPNDLPAFCNEILKLLK
jgi:protease I